MAMTLITTNPDSTDVASVSFTSSIDSTYKLYIFTWYNVNGAVDNDEFGFQASVDGGSNYGVTVTTSFFRASHGEGGAGGALGYETGSDNAQNTNKVQLTTNQSYDADANHAGTLYLFNPSNTTYVKHFYARASGMKHDDYAFDDFCAGYFNTTDNVDAIKFQMFNGNMDGVIKMYGVG